MRNSLFDFCTLSDHRPFVSEYMHIVTKLSLTTPIILFFFLLLTNTCIAAPEDRGAMGGVVSVSSGGFLGAGTDGNASRLSSSVGGMFRIGVGEEVWPGLFLGLSSESYFGQTQDDLFETNLFTFGLDARYRINRTKNRGLLLIGGIGIGGGGFTSMDGDEELGGSSGGSIWKLGVAYEIAFNNEPSGSTLTPALLYQRLGPQMESSVSVDMVSLGIGFNWAFGRSRPKVDTISSIKN